MSSFFRSMSNRISSESPPCFDRSTSSLVRMTGYRVGIVLLAASLFVPGVGHVAHGAEAQDAPSTSRPDSPPKKKRSAEGDWRNQWEEWARRFEEPQEPEEEDEEESELKGSFFRALGMAVRDSEGGMAAMAEMMRIKEECESADCHLSEDEVAQKKLKAFELMAPYVTKAYQAAEPQFQKLQTKHVAKDRSWLQSLLEMGDADFRVVAPLLERVIILRDQYQLASRLGDQQSHHAFDIQQCMTFDMFNRIYGRGDPVVPSVRACVDGQRALHSMIGDRQASAAEIAAAVAKLREAQKQFHAALDKAESELRAVLTPRQQGLLVQEGLID